MGGQRERDSHDYMSRQGLRDPVPAAWRDAMSRDHLNRSAGGFTGFLGQ